MKFTELKLGGVFKVEIEPQQDSRGYFARTWSEEDFSSRGLVSSFSQCSISHNTAKGTVRGMHYQTSPHEETKIVSCIRGAIVDVVIDLRPDSPTYTQSITVPLSADDHTMLYIPSGFAHGFQSLEDGSEVYYQISAPYAPDFARGVRWNDQAFSIVWPLPVAAISDRDKEYEDFTPTRKDPV